GGAGGGGGGRGKGGGGCDGGGVVWTAPATTGRPSHPGETRAQAPGPASQPSGHRAHLKAKLTVGPRALRPMPGRANAPRSTRPGRLGKHFGRLRLAARSAGLRGAAKSRGDHIPGSFYASPANRGQRGPA